MSRCPFAKWRPLPENATQGRITPTQIIAHTAVDAPGPTSLWRFFNGPRIGAESHFWVASDGSIEQFMDTEVRANCNRYADSRAISIETEDDGVIQAWTPAQVEALILLIAWLCKEHDIPAELCPAWDKPGIGWHSMWGFRDPIAQTGPIDNPWSYYKGKVCPGKPRIAQLRLEIVPAVVGALTPAPDPVTPAIEEDDMPPARYICCTTDNDQKDGRPAGYFVEYGATEIIAANGAPEVKISGKVVAIEDCLVVTRVGDRDFHTYDLGSA